MPVEPGDIVELLATGQFAEGIDLEAKTASGNVPKSAWETISAFANTTGGALVLGLEEREEWTPVGVGQARKMIQDLHSAMRNKGKISIDVCGQDDIWIESIDGVDLVVIRVSPASRRNKPVFVDGDRDRAFIRRDQNDARCTEDELERMRREAMSTSYDAQVLPGFTLDDLDSDSIRRYREESKVARPHLSLHQLETLPFLRASRAWGKDRSAGLDGPTVAGLLMFGTEEAIFEIRSNHAIDYRRIANPSSTVRWIDRLRWTGNLYSAWGEILPRLLRSLPVPFRLQGVQRVDEPAGQSTVREALANLLMHTDYRELADAVIEDLGDRYVFSNPGNSWTDIEDLGVETRPVRRNPCLATLFQNVGWAEQAGSGYITIFKEWVDLGYRRPVAVSDPDEYSFRLTLSLSSMISPEDLEWLRSFGESWTEAEELALLFARHEGSVDNARLRSATGQHLFDASQTLRSLRNRGYLTLEAAGRNSFYRLGPSSLSSTGHVEPGEHESAATEHESAATEHESVSTKPLEDVVIRTRLQAIASPIAEQPQSHPESIRAIVLQLCADTPLSSSELAQLLNRHVQSVRRYLHTLVESGLLEPTEATPRHPAQRYRLRDTREGETTQTELPFQTSGS